MREKIYIQILCFAGEAQIISNRRSFHLSAHPNPDSSILREEKFRFITEHQIDKYMKTKETRKLHVLIANERTW